jgi:hypothetical protein
VKLVHLVGFITKKFVTMQHGHLLRCTVTLTESVNGYFNWNKLMGKSVHLVGYSHVLYIVTCFSTETVRHQLDNGYV